ncbi:dienelactone hydrolase family protein [Halobacillus litoralis]|uniref:Dienelactone hydrolase n=1 Tax=Halobacillus litoralis TaxID=45668 RepID=A0A410MBV3_9BACI|nr:alpha/beta hydrolase family protein [Halobacillus litoralis]QAS52168.1 dienelactone hydrolase [Halobacillus litoralis]
MNEINHYLMRLYDGTTAHQESIDIEKLTEVLGDFPQVEPREYGFTEELVDCGLYLRHRVFFSSVEGMKVPMYILTPKTNSSGQEVPAVLALHGHGYGSREMVGLFPNGSNRTFPTIHNDLAVQLVKKGMKVFVPEIIGFGDRKLEEDREKENSCYTLATHLLMAGKTLAGLRTYEARGALDYIKDVDQQDCVGVIGFSGGGLIATLTSILDDRIQATVLSGFPSTFKGSILASEHCIDNYIPGLLNLTEMPQLIGLIAPKALFIEAGEDDPVFPSKHTKLAIEKIEAIYQRKNKEYAFQHEIFQGGHEVSGDTSLEWLRNHLI